MEIVRCMFTLDIALSLDFLLLDLHQNLGYCICGVEEIEFRLRLYTIRIAYSFASQRFDVLYRYINIALNDGIDISFP